MDDLKLVVLDGANESFQVSSESLQDLFEKDSVEYLKTLGGVEELARKLGTSIKTGLPSEEARTGYSQRIATYVGPDCDCRIEYLCFLMDILPSIRASRPFPWLTPILSLLSLISCRNLTWKSHVYVVSHWYSAMARTCTINLKPRLFGE